MILLWCRAIPLAAVFLAFPVQAGTADTPQCRRDVFFARQSLSDSRASLERADTEMLASRCVAWHRQAETAEKAGSVFARCLTGAERGDAIADMKDSATGFRELLKQKCPRL